ncbi:uncharacterized protein VP01_707g5 [Puccinia sorghi]|uniref:Uncharacterized protein n=1 Tax=Puccinia sorghi TaxID=27349 RepID=A0A0L6UFT3_9BASI|nr:uncharacterized protein VP01_707g5 [Puccinia sorghi]
MANPMPEDFFNLQNKFPQMGKTVESVLPDGTAVKSSMVINKTFLKLPAEFHSDHNPRKVAYNGSNFPIWEGDVNMTLQDNRKQAAISCMFHASINNALLGISKCSQSNRLHKLNWTDQFITLASNKAPGLDVEIARWSKIMAELAALKITWDKAVGLVLQKSFLAPAGLEKPSFSNLTTFIQAASSKSKNKTCTEVDYQPMDLDAIHADRYHPQGRCDMPHC